MAIAIYNDWLAAFKPNVSLTKTQTATTVAAQWHTLFDRAGAIGAGSLAIGNTANGLVPTDANTGFPDLPALAGAEEMYLAGIDFGSTVACRLKVYDRLFHAGSYSLTSLATTNLTAQPSYLGRLPGSLYSGLEIWLEFNAAVSATATTVSVGYTNQAGTAGRSTGATASLSGFITGRMLRLPYQAGDSSPQLISSITVGGTVATTGSVNVIVARPIWSGRVLVANGGDTHGIERTKLKRLFADSALCAMVAADSTSSGVPDLDLTLAIE